MTAVKDVSLFTFGEKRILRYVILFTVLSRLVLALRPEVSLYSFPYTEDGFYLFTCAEHLANGDRLSADGIHPTNGVQPLLVFLYVPLFLIAGLNKVLALRLSFVLVALFDVLSVLFISRIVRLMQKKPDEDIPFWQSPPLVAAVLWGLLFPILTQTANGLETGLYSTLLLASLYLYFHISRSAENRKKVSMIKWTGLGILLGFTVLARIDAVFFVIALAIFQCWKTKKVLPSLIFSFEQAIPLSGLHTIIPKVAIGFGDRTVPRMEQFDLGGIESFYGLSAYELRGKQMAKGSLTYQIAIPNALFFPTFVTFRYDLGAMWTEPESIKFEAFVHGIGAQVGFKTPIGLARFAIGENFRFADSKERPLLLNYPIFYFSIGANL